LRFRSLQTQGIGKKGKDTNGPSRDEQLIAKRFFLNRNSLVIKAENHVTIKQAINIFQKSLAMEYEKLIKAPTTKGRQVMDQRERLKLYLSVAERTGLTS
jgi:hypothetical protein